MGMVNTVRLHVEKPADEPIGLWIREIKVHGEIYWELIWIIVILDIPRQEIVSKAKYISLYNNHYNRCTCLFQN